MTAQHVFELVRLVAVIALVVVAAALATPPGRLPLALRGLVKIMRRDNGTTAMNATKATAPVWKRALAFVLVLAAAALALV